MQTTFGSPPTTTGGGLRAGPLQAPNAGGVAPLADAAALTLIDCAEVTSAHVLAVPPEPTLVAEPLKMLEPVQLVLSYLSQVASNVTPAGPAALIRRTPSVNVVVASTASSAPIASTR